MDTRNSPNSLLLLAAYLVLFLGLALRSSAQTPASELTPNVPLEASFDVQNRVNIHRFTLVESASVSLNAQSDALGVVLVISDAQGTQWAQALPSEAGTLAQAALAAGSYLVTSFPVEADAEGVYTLVLSLETVALEVEATSVPAEASAESTEAASSATFTAPNTNTGWTAPAQILVANGISVTLNWAAAVDLNLEVRDPVGNSLYWEVRESANGGSFGFDANAFCQNVVSPASEAATWQAGFVPSGSYEILVSYRQSCEATPAPVDFSVQVTVNGTALPPIEGVLSPPLPNQSSVYLSSFVLAQDTTASIGRGGVYPDSSLNILPDTPAAILSKAVPIGRDSTVTNALYASQPYVSYSFEGQADEVVSINLRATSGSLDTLLQLVDSAGNLVAVNDDSNASKNSQLLNQRLVTGGTYTVVATRYGKEIGGTEGDFELSVSQGQTTVPAEIANLELTAGDIQVALTWATSADVQLLVRDPSGEAVFDDRPLGRSGGILARNGNVNCVRAAGNPVSYIYWPQGTLPPGSYEVEVWYQADCQDTTPVTFTLAAIVDGAPIISESQTITVGQRYVISFTVNPDRSARAGRGGYIGGNSSTLNYLQETPLSIALNQTLVGSINADNVFDVYAFSGTTGQRVNMIMAASTPSLDTKLFLISPSGIEVADNDDGGANSPTGRATDAVISNFTLPEDGQYLIIATRFATVFGGTTGGYSLVVQGG